MPKFTDKQLRFHASQPGWPANELAAELLSAREELARPYRAGNLEAENEVWDRLVAERDALRARLARVVKAAQDHMDAAHYPEITETPTTTEMALFYALEEVSDAVVGLGSDRLVGSRSRGAGRGVGDGKGDEGEG